MAESSNRLLDQLRERSGGQKSSGRSAPSNVERITGNRAPKESARASFATRVIVPLIDRVTNQGSIFMRNVDLDEGRYRLMRAGFPRNLNARTFHFVKCMGIFIGGPILYFYVMFIFLPLLSIPSNFAYEAISMIFGSYIGFRMPDIWLNSLIRKRTFAIQLALPDMIDLVAISVEAGLGLYAALQRVAMRFPGPLSEEILRTLQEIRLGRTRVESMRDLGKRVDLTDLTVFITALVQAEVLGLSVANVLKIQSERLREKRRQRARETAQKAPIKMLLPLVFFIFPALFVVILGPAVIRMLGTGTL